MHKIVLTPREEELLKNLVDVDTVSLAASRCKPLTRQRKGKTITTIMTTKRAYNLLALLRNKYQVAFQFVNSINKYKNRGGLCYKVLTKRMGVEKKRGRRKKVTEG
jgi:hypothetical protein